MDPRAHYVARVLSLYMKIPGTLKRTLRADRSFARELYDKGVAFDTVESAFVLAVARRTLRDDTEPIEPIRCLRYLSPVIQELAQEPPFPEYIEYLKTRLIDEGTFPLD